MRSVFTARNVFTAFVAASAIVYASVLLRMLIFRNPAGIGHVMGLPRQPFSYSNNIVPFKTILNYAGALADRSMSRSIPIQNLAGNFFLLMPTGFYLPFFNKKMAELKNFAIAVSGAIIAVELAQYIFRIGSLDIDDYILNMAGALIGFLICKHTPARRLFALRAY